MNAIFSLLIRNCPVCERLGRKSRIVRQSVRDWGVCARCGFRVAPEAEHVRNGTGKVHAHVH